MSVLAPVAAPQPLLARLALPILIAGAIAIAFSPIFVRLAREAGVGETAAAFWRVALAVPPFALAWTLGSGALRSGGLGSGAHDPAAPAGASARALPVGLLVVAGLCFAGDLVTWHWSIALTSVANATLLPNLAPVFVALGAWLLFRQRPSGAFALGLALALGGVVLLVLARPAAPMVRASLAGDALAVVTALFYAAYILAVSRLRQTVEAVPLMTLSTAVTALAILPVALASGEAFLPAQAAGWLPLLGLGLVCHAGGQGAIALALAHLPPAFSSLTLLVQPVCAALLAWVILAEPVGPLQALAGILVLAGVWVARR